MLNKRLFQKVLLDSEQEKQWQFFVDRAVNCGLFVSGVSYSGKKRSFL